MVGKLASLLAIPLSQVTFPETSTNHRVGKGCRHGNKHPPYDSGQELLSIALDQRLDNGAVHLGHTNTNQSPQYKEEAVADQQSRLFAAPSRHHDPQEAQ